MYQEGPEYEPETPEGPAYVEHGLPAQVLAQVGGGWHGDHCAKWSPSRDERGEPDYHYYQNVSLNVLNYSGLTCFSLVVLPS